MSSDFLSHRVAVRGAKRAAIRGAWRAHRRRHQDRAHAVPRRPARGTGVWPNYIETPTQDYNRLVMDQISLEQISVL